MAMTDPQLCTVTYFCY